MIIPSTPGSLSAWTRVLFLLLLLAFAMTSSQVAATSSEDANASRAPDRPSRASDQPPRRFGGLEQYLRTVRENAAMQQTESGLLIRMVSLGSGSRPRPEDTVVLTLSAKASDGSTDLPQLAMHSVHLRMGDLLPGLAEGLRMVALGGRALLVVPPQLSFGGGQWPNGITRGTPLFFLVDLEDVISPKAQTKEQG